MSLHICVSTANQVVNLLPAIQMKAERIILISTEDARRNHWTAHLEWVCRRKGLPVRIVPITREAEKSPERMLAELPADVGGPDAIWNISGGKKSMTLGLLHGLGQRGGRVMYTENRPHEIVMYEGDRFVSANPMNCFLDLEDLLNLNGFTQIEGEGVNKPLASVAEPRYSWAAAFARYYREHHRFQELMNRLFTTRGVDLREKENLEEAVRRLLHAHRPDVEAILEDAPDFDANARGNIGKAVARCHPVRGKAPDISGVLNACHEHYWNHLKRRLTPALAGLLLDPVHPLLTPAPDESEARELRRMFEECGSRLRKEAPGFAHGNVQLPERPGFFFEKAVAAEFLRGLTHGGLERFIPHARLNVATAALSYDGKDRVIPPESRSDGKDENDDEFDIVVVTPWGALHIFDAKIHYGKGGDVLRSSRDSAATKGGVFGRVTFIDPLLECRKTPEGDYPNLFHENLTTTRKTLKRLGMPAWSFDEIQDKLVRLLKDVSPG